MAEQGPTDNPTPNGGNSIKAHLKKRWPLYVVCIGGAILVMFFLANRQASSADTTAAAATPLDLSGVNPYPQGVQDANGYDNSSDSVASMLQGLNTQNAQILQTLASGGTTTNTNTWPQVPNVANIGDAGVSKNSWVYTIKPGDTYQSLTQKAGWQNARPDMLETYSGNQSIFQALGVNGPADATKQLTPGYQVRL